MEFRLDLNANSVYTYNDLNRLEANALKLKDTIINMWGSTASNAITYTPRATAWSINDFIYATDIDRLVANIKSMADFCLTKPSYFPNWNAPELPKPSSVYPYTGSPIFDYSFFDKIERNLYHIYEGVSPWIQ